MLRNQWKSNFCQVFSDLFTLDMLGYVLLNKLVIQVCQVLSFPVWHCSKLCLKILCLLLSYTAVVTRVLPMMNFTFKEIYIRV